MRRLLVFLVKLSREQFYGDVTLRFRDGAVTQVTVNASHIMDTLPQGNVTEGDLQKLLAKPVKGVSLG